MREANSETTTSPGGSAPPRRLLLSLAALAPLAAFPAAAELIGGHDAELIALSAQVDELEHRIAAMGEGPDRIRDDDEFETAKAPLDARWRELLARIYELRATTPAGILARARTLAIHAGHGGYSLDINWSTCAGSMVAVLLRDVLLMSGLPLTKRQTEEEV